ncbi:hypothetical protein BT63DRAFT_458357 [Microthyrium microscopicum]|uniref:Pali-domain-containing protein n=1 Tax=Microthyrium microscopicum TaxID=703497 RepID=A0A6A6U4W7_9PEZI|nr:hypothetical protein BT63DRAFT_458357 [Microthyrium microscopicum]
MATQSESALSRPNTSKSTTTDDFRDATRTTSHATEKTGDGTVKGPAYVIEYIPNKNAPPRTPETLPTRAAKKENVWLAPACAILFIILTLVHIGLTGAIARACNAGDSGKFALARIVVTGDSKPAFCEKQTCVPAEFLIGASGVLYKGVDGKMSQSGGFLSRKLHASALLPAYWSEIGGGADQLNSTFGILSFLSTNYARDSPAVSVGGALVASWIVSVVSMVLVMMPVPIWYAVVAMLGETLMLLVVGIEAVAHMPAQREIGRGDWILGRLLVILKILAVWAAIVGSAWFKRKWARRIKKQLEVELTSTL